MKSLKYLKEKFQTKDYYYVTFPNKETIFEFSDINIAKTYSKTFGGIFWEHYPYEEYNFKDPYIFTNTWTVLNEDGDIVEYHFEENGNVMEVTV